MEFNAGIFLLVAVVVVVAYFVWRKNSDKPEQIERDIADRAHDIKEDVKDKWDDIRK